MSIETWTSGKSLVTNCTNVRFFSCVSPHVPLQQTRPVKCFSTYGAGQHGLLFWSAAWACSWREEEGRGVGEGGEEEARLEERGRREQKTGGRRGRFRLFSGIITWYVTNLFLFIIFHFPWHETSKELGKILGKLIHIMSRVYNVPFQSQWASSPAQCLHLLNSGSLSPWLKILYLLLLLSPLQRRLLLVLLPLLPVPD